ncbi:MULTISPECIES: DNA cytosine methyltransferase [Campylobacter]|uniref:DNA cytosine methyltransferase n=1 Tax=Campylobacter TaxID=194 RepID=UPI000A354CB9|nr:DNA cytosine methyltransferase [Campylobacter sp. P0024]MCR8679724.1 DNA cytosine methyltransferase [Campylobacter sp. RM19072]MCR8696947.1 DNA cytosine methyltransferase [Campylobacter sp. RM19073]
MALNGLSLFSSAGIAEMNLANCNIKMKLANELLPIRAKTHEFWHPNSKMICGDITQSEIKNEIIKEAKKAKIDFILATPPLVKAYL